MGVRQGNIVDASDGRPSRRMWGVPASGAEMTTNISIRVTLWYDKDISPTVITYCIVPPELGSQLSRARFMIVKLSTFEKYHDSCLLKPHVWSGFNVTLSQRKVQGKARIALISFTLKQNRRSKYFVGNCESVSVFEKPVRHTNQSAWSIVVCKVVCTVLRKADRIELLAYDGKGRVLRWIYTGL